MKVPPGTTTNTVCPDYRITNTATIHEHRAIPLPFTPCLTLHALESGGIKNGDVVILSMRSNENCLAASVSENPWKDRLKPYGNTTESNKIRYCSIYAFKGMEAPVVVVTDIDTFNKPATKSLLYVASTRALGQLIMLANHKVRTLIDQALDRGKLHS